MTIRGYRTTIVNKPVLALKEVRARERRETSQRIVKIQHRRATHERKELARRDPKGALALPWGLQKNFLERMGFKAQSCREDPVDCGVVEDRM